MVPPRFPAAGFFIACTRGTKTVSFPRKNPALIMVMAEVMALGTRMIGLPCWAGFDDDLPADKELLPVCALLLLCFEEDAFYSPRFARLAILQYACIQ